MRPERWSAAGTLGTPDPALELAGEAPAALDPGLLQLARELAHLAPADERRAVFLLAAAVLALGEEGSTRLPLAPGLLHPRLLAFGATAEDLPAIDRFLERARRGEAALAGPPTGPAPLVVDDDHLTSARLLARERELGGRWSALLPAAAEPAPGLEAALADVLARPPLDATGAPTRLSVEQQEAIRRALGGRLAAITGGPGTGKTSLVVALLRVWARLRPAHAEQAATAVALAAPTGRAADRLASSVSRALAAIADPGPADAALAAAPPAAATLHRLLSWSPSGERFRRHAGNPLPHALVVVDESSMIDLDLATRLTRARGSATLVLLGDAEQLPPVAEGAPFRDLVRSGRNVARLTHSFRMDAADPAGRLVLALAETVRRGEVPGPEVLPRRASAAALTLAEPELLAAGGGEREAFLERWILERVVAAPGWRQGVERVWTETELAHASTLAPLFGVYEASRLLVAVRSRSGGAGLAAVDAWVRARLASLLDLDPRLALPPAQPVLVTRNDYERGLFNGDQGVVLRVELEDGRSEERAVFRRGDAFISFPLPALEGALEPSWAVTVHKAQGGEHDHVALMLPDRPVRTLTRELLYTAITRARRTVTLVGSEERLAAAVASPGGRRTGLATALGVAAASPAETADPGGGAGDGGEGPAGAGSGERARGRDADDEEAGGNDASGQLSLF